MFLFPTFVEKLKILLNEPSLDNNTLFSTCKQWDSLTKIALLSLCQEYYGQLFSVAQINHCTSLNDLMDLLKNT